MSIQNLSPEKMIEHTRRWTTPTEPAGKILSEVGAVTPAIEELREVQTLLTAPPQSAAPTANQEEEALTALLAGLDDHFDRRVRGAYFVFKGLIDLAEDEETRQRLIDIQRSLLPKGTGTTQLSYREEAGIGPSLSQQLTDPTTQATLRAITLPWPPKTLADTCDEIVSIAQQLGSADAEREQLRQQATPKALVVPADSPSLFRVKQRWARAVKLLRKLVTLAKLGPESEASLFQTLDQDIQIAKTKTKSKT